MAFALGLVAARGAEAAMRFDVPDQCGTEADFREELAALAGDAASELEPSVLEISEAGPQGYRLHLEVQGEVRELVDPDCQTLLRTAVVIAAAAARGDAAESPPPPPDPALPEPALPASPEPSPTAAIGVPVAPAPPPEVVVDDSALASRPASAESVSSDIASSLQVRAAPARPPTFALGAGIGISAGTLPGASATLELRGGLDPNPIGFAVSARYWPGSGAEREGRSIHVTGLGGCAAALFELVPALHASLGLAVDRLSGTGREGVSGRTSESAWHLASVLELNAIPWSIEELRLELGVSAQVSLIRPRFVVTGFGDVYEVPLLGGAAIIRGVWLFR